MFIPDKPVHTAIDPERGIRIFVGGTVDLDTPNVTVRFPDGRVVFFGLAIEKTLATDGTEQFSICLLIAGVNHLAKFRNGTRSENTEFVRYVLQGLSVIHKKWPIVGKGRFCTDRERYADRDLKTLFDFDIPGEDEISRL